MNLSEHEILNLVSRILRFIFLIIVECDVEGYPKGEIRGNQLCWYGNFEYVTKDTEDPSHKLLQRYDKRHKKYGKRNFGDSNVKRALFEWCKLCGVPTDKVNNMWARKSFVNTALRELQLPEQQVMDVTGHKNAVQMRKDYNRKV